MKTVKLTLDERDLTLLLSFLDEVRYSRSECGCNDPIEAECSLFSKKEIKAIIATQTDSDGGDYCPDDCTFIGYLQSKIEKQAIEAGVAITT